MLTDAEQAVLDKISLVSKGMHELMRPGDSTQNAFDWQETAADIHRLQHRVMARATARDHPDRFRRPAGDR